MPEIADEAVAAAQDLFSRGYNCAQSVCVSLGERYGLTREQCFAVAAAFGGGVGRHGELCGAVAGALMVLGLSFGAVPANDPQSKSQVYAQVARFLAEFKARHGAIICRDLLGCDLGTPEGFAQMQERNLHVTHCARFVCTAVEIMEGMLES